MSVVVSSLKKEFANEADFRGFFRRPICVNQRNLRTQVLT
ncbi:MAG: hypothetical protein BWX84_00695 [Verrucomicrobia bacterium ADurb.Bin118]|nr:MAG: hypothetical protein BWX84_00695 [Verrucomicrobia bacterium ADurb.Bin118]